MFGPRKSNEAEEVMSLFGLVADYVICSLSPRNAYGFRNRSIFPVSLSNYIAQAYMSLGDSRESLMNQIQFDRRQEQDSKGWCNGGQRSLYLYGKTRNSLTYIGVLCLLSLPVLRSWK